MRGFREKIIASMPGTTAELEKKSGASVSTVKFWVKEAMLSRDCHIEKWCKIRGIWTPRYAAGHGPGAGSETIAHSMTVNGIVYDRPPKAAEVVLGLLPGGLVSISQKTDLTKETIRLALRKLHAGGEIHISDWERHSENYAAMPIFSAGRGDDAPCTLTKMTKKETLLRYEEKVRMNSVKPAVRSARSRQLVFDALPGRLETIIKKTGLNPQTARRWLDDIHESGESHIGRWDLCGSSAWSAWYVAGSGADANGDFLVPSHRVGQISYATPPTSDVIVFDSLPGSVTTIAPHVKIAADTIRQALRRLHADEKIHICDWVRNDGNNTNMAVYAQGKGVDAACTIKSPTPKEAYKLKRERIKASQPVVVTNRELVLKALPGRKDTVMASTKLSSSAVRRWLKDIHEKGDSHVTKWIQVTSGAWMPYFAPGPGVDAKCDHLVPQNAKGVISYDVPPGSDQMIMDALPGSSLTINDRLPIGDTTVRNRLKILHKSEKIHIADWERSSGNGTVIPVYAAGKGVDAVCNLKPLTPQEISLRKKKFREAAKKSVITARMLVFNSLPGRIDTVISKTGLAPSTVRRWMKDIYEAKESHISGWKQMLSGVWVPRYSPGPGVDAKCDFLLPKNVKGGISYDAPPTAEQMVLDALPGSALTIIDRLTLSSATVRFHLQRLHKRGEIRISKWEFHKTMAIKMPVFSKGSGRDAVCKLKDLTPDEVRDRRNEARRKKRELDEQEKKQKYSAAMDPDGWDTYAMRKEAIRQAEEAKKNGDPIVMAFFGMKPRQQQALAGL